MTFYEINNTRTSKQLFYEMKKRLDMQRKDFDVIKKHDLNNNVYHKLFCKQEYVILVFTSIYETK